MTRQGFNVVLSLAVLNCGLHCAASIAAEEGVARPAFALEDIRRKKDMGKAMANLDFSGDGSMLVGGLPGAKVKVWKAKDGAEIATLEMNADNFRPLVFHPNRPLVLQLPAARDRDTDPRARLALSPDGQLLAYLLGAGASAQAPVKEPPTGPEREARLARSPRQLAEQLAAVYGHNLKQVAYIPALPLVAKLRLSELTGEAKYAEEVNKIVAPFLRGDKSPVPKSGSAQAGHLIFAELALHAKGKDRERWIALCRAAADQIFDKEGKTLSIMPYHSEMSDAVFMAGPILALTGKLTGERKYFDAAAGHFASMRKLCLRPDGLYRHSPLNEAAWGRGNGFPALGLAWALSDWPDDHRARKELIAEFQKHMAALKRRQDAKTGCWHQVIDHPESYDEYSCTCMIGFAMQRGIRRGWLAKDEYQPCVDLAWRAIKERTSADGKLVNVCAGTGKQKTLQAYFDRPAINGRDDRGGAMGLMFATELMAR